MGERPRDTASQWAAGVSSVSVSNFTFQEVDLKQSVTMPRNPVNNTSEELLHDL